MQDVQEGVAITKRFHSIMQGLVDGMRKEQPAESSIAAHLLSIKDPESGEDMLYLTPEDKSACITYRKACVLSHGARCAFQMP